MPDHFQEIYAHKADLYQAMVSREDYRGNILPALMEICPLDGLDVVEFGAGTGRLTRLLGFCVQHIYAFDLSPSMLDVAKSTLELTGMTNWSLVVGDSRRMPVANRCADLALAGWSFGHAQSWYPDTWREEIGLALGEMVRVLRPGGTAVILETMGTGQKQPTPPTEGLAAYYAWLENEHGFSYSWIRTDYQFESVAEADNLTRFFFGDELADRIVREQMTILPECTGIWGKRL